MAGAQLARFDAKLLLPLSYALSRPALASWGVDKFVATVPFLLASIIGLHIFDRMLRALAASDEHGADALLSLISLAVQLAGSAALWLIAEVLALQGIKYMPIAAAAVTHETIFGLLGIGGTAVAFVLPRALRASRGGPRPWWLRWLGLVHLLLNRMLLLGGLLTSGGDDEPHSSPSIVGRQHSGSSPLVREGGGGGRYEDSSPPRGVLPAPTSLTPDTRSRGGTQGHAAMMAPPLHLQRSGSREQPPHVAESRRRPGELFGVRRAIKAAFFRAAGSLAEVGEGIEGDGGWDSDGGGGGGGNGNQIGRHPTSASGGGALRRARAGMRGESIVANTEAMTQLALAAKNDELERISAARAELLRGVAEVLAVLSRATQSHAASVSQQEQQAAQHQASGSNGHSSSTNGHGTANGHNDTHVTNGGSATNGSAANGVAAAGINSQPPSAPVISARERSLLNAALNAQAWLQSLLQSHSNEVHSHQRERRGSSPAVMADGHGGGGGVSNNRDDMMPMRGGGAHQADGLTWTSALGVEDVHAKLYRSDSRGGFS